MQTLPSRTVLVTGGTDGIGRAVSRCLAKAGHDVVIVGRDAGRAAQVLDELYRLGARGNHGFVAGDLSLLSDTSRVADEILRLAPRLDSAVFCAGVLSLVPTWTSEGLERSLVLNYLSRHLLARRLMPVLAQAASGRLVLVANAGNYRDTLDLRDLQYRQGRPGLDVSGRTQFANDLLAIELHERSKRTGVQVSCVFPGLVKTGVFRNAVGLPLWARVLAPLAQRIAGLEPELAALTPVYLATDPDAASSGGRFFGPRCREKKVPEAARRPERRAALWAVSDSLVREYLSGASPLDANDPLDPI
jgi:NAD(P)-dependent dehydrogenase (short-subunit alcohol dehydrogenase family)